VIVEGVTYGDGNATVVRAGESSIAEAKLGQRVRVEHENNQASRITVWPQLIGSATTAPNGQGDFQMLGQRVRIISATNGALPPTVFDGLTQVQIGDAIEVHGSWSQVSGQNVLMASRIEKLTALPSTVLVTAPVLSRTGHTLVLDDNARTNVVVNDVADSVQAGGLVSLWLDAGTLASSPWVAVRSLDARPQPASNQSLSLDAVVSVSDAGNARIRLQGLDIRLPASVVSQLPAVGAPVHVEARRQGDEWVASSLSATATDTAPAVQLKGSITWGSGTGTLAVRGTTVNLNSGQALDASCAGISAGDEVYVTISAARSAPGQPPQATQVICSGQIPATSVQEASGTLVSASSDTVVVSVRGRNLSLNITSFSLLPAALNTRIGRPVEIEYQQSGSTYQLRKLKLD
jgi:hypothetical protein